MVGKELALAIDQEHAALCTLLLSRPLHWGLPTLTWDEELPNRREVAKIRAFGILLKRLLLRDGYTVELSIDKGRTLPYTGYVRLLYEGMRPVVIWYCCRGYYYEVTYYSAHNHHSVVIRDGIENLLDRLPGIIDKAQKVMQCSSCYYSCEAVKHCGLGLVNTGNCSHYEGPALRR